MRFLIILAFLTTLLSCTKVAIEEPLPLANGLTMDSIETNLPIFNIILPQDSFDLMYEKYNKGLIMEAQIEYWENKNKKVFTQPGYIEHRGSYSIGFPMKSIGIRFNGKLNNGELQIVSTNKALPGHSLDKLQYIRLRNSGNDDYFTQFKDLALNEFLMSTGLVLELKYGRPAQVFVNNSYYGLLNIRTENNTLALSDLLQVNENDLTMIKMDVDNGNLECREGDQNLCAALQNAIKEKDAQVLELLIDLDNFIDYLIFQDYITNVDWPQNNARMYSVGGGKFKFLLYDLDQALTYTKHHRLPQMEFLNDDVSKIYQALRAGNEEFVSKLNERQAYWYGIFNPDNFDAIVDNFTTQYRGEVDYKIARWGYPASTLQWNVYVEQLKRDFRENDLQNRRKYNLN